MAQEVEVGEVITLSEEGEQEEHDFTVMYRFEIERQTYLCLVPVEQEEDEEYDVYFLKYNGTDVLEPIEDEQEWDNVQQTFETLMQEVNEEES